MAWQYLKIPKGGEEILEIKPPEEVAPKEVPPEEEITNWPIFSIEEYGFSIRIHPDYIKKEEQEKGGVKRIVFSIDKEAIVVVIDKSKIVKITRSTLFDMLRIEPEEYKEIIESTLDVELISTKNIKKGTCVGKWDHYLEKKSGKYSQTLEITSLNLENMHVIINFDYYDKKSEPKILKMIETIDCTK